VSLWLCLRFHQLPLQCLSHCEQQPVAVLAAQRVICANDCAAALGINPGMGTATVRALAGDEPVRLLERNEQAEQRWIRAYPDTATVIFLWITPSCFVATTAISPAISPSRTTCCTFC
jgi:hypothetical protein